MKVLKNNKKLLIQNNFLMKYFRYKKMKDDIIQKKREQIN